MEFLIYRRIKNMFITNGIRFNQSLNIFWLFDNFRKLVTLYIKLQYRYILVLYKIVFDIILLCYCCIIYA